MVNKKDWRGSENQKTSHYIIISYSSSPWHRVDQAVDCGLELEHAVVNVNPEHPKHAQWVTCLVSMQAMKELG
jgi:hypothetical protein